MEKKQYKIDDEPASAEDIINMARLIDVQFDNSHFYQTSVAADIIRRHGHIVDYNE